MPLTPNEPAAHALRQGADRHSRDAAIALAASLPTDTVLYLLLPMFHAAFGVTLGEAGVLLAANRLVRIVGYGHVARFYARHGDRSTAVLAVLAAATCALGHAVLSGFWALLGVRLLWGLAFAALNLSTQALATAHPVGVAARSGRSRALIAIGPLLMLPAAALTAQALGPRPIFLGLMVLALCGLFAAARLPKGDEPLQVSTTTPRARRPNALDAWSFLEGFTLDGLFVIGLSVLAAQLLPVNAVLAAGVLLALRYGAEIVLSPVGGRLADRHGAMRMLVVMSLLTAVLLVAFGAGVLWFSAAGIVVLRALQLPLIAPIVAQRHPGPERVRALAARSIWRDIGAGTGPIVAGFALTRIDAVWLYGVAAALLAASALACAKAWHPPGHGP